MQQRSLDLTAERRDLGAAGPRLARVGATLGIVGLTAGALWALLGEHGAARFFHAYLTAFAYCLSLALGALFFVILQHLTRSGWSVVVRRLAECIAAGLPMLALLALPVVFGMRHLYPWSHLEALPHAEAELLHGKQPYLNAPFFVARLTVCFAVWVLLARFFLGNSVRQDRTGDVSLTRRLERFSGPAMLLFAFTVTFAAFDLLMSLDPHWYSTIFGVYFFSGAVVGFFALLALTVLLVQRSGRLVNVITAEHHHDLGKLVFAFTVFWAYIAFSQYLLIWYANIPEETAWYLRRQSDGWAAAGLLLLFGHFVAPFLALISRWPKRRPALLGLCSLWVLAMHWLDVYWLVMPQAGPAGAPPLPEPTHSWGGPVLHGMNAAAQVGPTVVDVFCLLGVGGLCVAAVVSRMHRQSLIPERDPRLPESLMFENV